MQSNFVVSDCIRPFGLPLLINDTWLPQDSGIKAFDLNYQKSLVFSVSRLDSVLYWNAKEQAKS